HRPAGSARGAAGPPPPLPARPARPACPRGERSSGRPRDRSARRARARRGPSRRPPGAAADGIARGRARSVRGLGRCSTRQGFFARRRTDPCSRPNEPGRLPAAVCEQFGDDIEFDFFDEPETREDQPRRRAPRPSGDGGGPPRRRCRPPAGFTPLLRLAGLIACAILIVVLLVLWVQSCQGASKRNAYRHYMEKVTAIAQNSDQTGKEFNDLLTTPGLKEADLEAKLDSFAQQE